MIPKGNARGGGRQLATHLLNAFDNENVEVLEVRGAIARDLHGAFAEWYAQSKSTRCQKYLYSLSVNPDHQKYDLTRDQYLDFIDRTERSLKLVGQPRAVVFHTKNGRQHCHVVWTRILAADNRAVQLHQDRNKLRAVAQDFAKAHDLELPPGMRDDRGKDRHAENAKQSSHHEKQQQERSGLSKDERLAAIRAAWEQSNDGPSFVRALEDRGYLLAKGDQRAHVVVDRAGEVHSLSKQLTGIRAKDIRARLGPDYAPDKLPGVEAARIAQLEKLAAKENHREQEPEPAQEATGGAADGGTYQKTPQTLIAMQEKRRAALMDDRARIETRHGAEREALADLHASENAGVLSSRAASQPKGLRAFILRITGFQMIADVRHRRADAVRDQAHSQQRDALNTRHGRELQEHGRKRDALAAVEKRLGC